MFLRYQGLAVEVIQQSHSAIYKRLKEIDTELGGATAVLVAFIINNRLYVANIGWCFSTLFFMFA